jgi:hypothetical protein
MKFTVHYAFDPDAPGIAARNATTSKINEMQFLTSYNCSFFFIGNACLAHYKAQRRRFTERSRRPNAMAWHSRAYATMAEPPTAIETRSLRPPQQHLDQLPLLKGANQSATRQNSAHLEIF